MVTSPLTYIYIYIHIYIYIYIYTYTIDNITEYWNRNGRIAVCNSCYVFFYIIIIIIINIIIIIIIIIIMITIIIIINISFVSKLREPLYNRPRENMVGVNMVLAESGKFKHGLHKSCGI